MQTRPATERGAAAILIAFAMVVLVGFMAFAIDPGVLFQEKRDLQTGADAAALAIAQDCALGNCGDYQSTAAFYLDENTTNGTGRIVDISFTSNTVTVVVGGYDTANNRDGDANTTDLYFGPVVGVDSFDVQASATAAWDSIGGGATLPLIFGLCEFLEAGVDADSLPSSSFVIGFHFGAGPEADPDEPCYFSNGQDVDEEDERLPGGFGWLQEDICKAYLTEDNWVGAKTGNATPGGCSPEDLGLVVGELILIPIFDDISSTGCPAGSSRCYHVYAFAGLRIEGFKFPGNAAWRDGNYQTTCSTLGPGSSESCISGHVESIIEPGAQTGGPNFGAVTIQLVG